MGIAHEVGEHFRQNPKKGEAGPPCKEEGAPKNNSYRQFFFIGMKTGCDKDPGLIEDERETCQKSYKKREFNVGEKRFGKIGVDKPVHQRTCLKKRGDEKSGNLF